MKLRNIDVSESRRGLPHSTTIRDIPHRRNIRRVSSAAVLCRFVALICVSSSVLASDVERIGTIDPEIKECSGVVMSHRFPEVFWVHSDGAREHLYAINRKGAILSEFKVKGATFHDWEDITLDTNNNLYAADTGDNNSKRPEVGVYQFPEPDPNSGKKSVHVARQWRLRYPTGPRDCESIVVLGTNCFLITKMTRNRLPEVFTFPLQDSTELITLKPMANLLIDSPVTAVAVAPDGKRLAAISKMGAFFFHFDGTFPSNGIMRPYRQVPYVHQSMEGCTFVPEGLLVTSESHEIFLFKVPAH